MKLIIDRSRWARGGKNGFSFLQNEQGNMCCLGFLALACGYSKSEIMKMPTPAAAVDEYGTDESRRFPDGILTPSLRLDSHRPWNNSEECIYLIRVNDDLCIDDASREQRLAHAFHKMGVEVEFVDAQ